jgi:putative membrane protein
MGGWGFLLMTVTSLVWVLLVVAGVVLLVRLLARGSQPGAGGAVLPPEQVLAARYARGEIDDEEYHRRLATLAETAAVRRPGP